MHDVGTQVMAVAINSGIVAFPTGYECVTTVGEVKIWRPLAPEGYVVLGCLAGAGSEPPAPSQMVCVHASVAVDAPLASCFLLRCDKHSNAQGADAGTPCPDIQSLGRVEAVLV